MKKRWQEIELKWRMIILLVLGWLIPIVLASIIVSVVVSTKLSSQMSENVSASMSKAVSTIDAQLETVRRSSRNATYFNVIREQYLEYKGSRDSQKLYEEISLYLAQQYRYDPALTSAMVFFTQDPSLFYSTYSAGTTYDNISKFKEEYLEEALSISEGLDTGLLLCTFGDSLYLMRNLVDSAYKPEAVIVMGINTDYLFDSLESIWGCESCAVYLDDELVYGTPDSKFMEITDLKEGVPVLIKAGGDYIAYYVANEDNGRLAYVVRLDRAIVKAELKIGYYILLILLVSLIPLSVAVFAFFDRMVTKPVEGLVNAASEIANENYGYTIETEGHSKEFSYVNNAFNNMSVRLKEQFETIYLEELAVRDANIKALQSQINPHFINNTLEIINWEARLNGVYKVSAMIEALSTMLNATLNRKNDHSISLSEELEYVDAYLYVISQRMGSRLTINKDIDESLLKEQVPRLIAQPIIENAVEHGIKTSANGYINIRVFAKDRYMYIEIRNSGNMSKEDEEKIRKILGDDNSEENTHSVSIGINNVNKRLKLMYGETCGLTIRNEGSETVNLLTFLREERDEKETNGIDAN